MISPQIVSLDGIGDPEHDGCEASYATAWEEHSDNLLFKVDKTFFTLTAKEAPGWEFCKFAYRQIVSGNNPAEHYNEPERLDTYEEDGVGFVFPRPTTIREQPYWLYLFEGTEVPNPEYLPGSPAVSYTITECRAVFKRANVSTGQILHGVSGAVLCGAAGLPIFHG